MSAGVWFWLLYVVLLLFGGWLSWGKDRQTGGAFLVVMVLVGLLGWGIFGPPLR